MRRRHPHRRKIAVGSASIVAFAGLLGTIDEFLQHRAADKVEVAEVADANETIWALQQQVCELRHGHWKGTRCVVSKP